MKVKIKIASGEYPESLSFIRRMYEDKEAIQQAIAKGDNFSELKQRGIRFIKPL